MMIEEYLRQVPKAELHVHLEGSIQPATLLTLAERNGVHLPYTTVSQLQQWFTYRDFPHFAEIFFLISSCLRTAEDYELITYEFGATMAQQHIRYAEITFSPSTHAARLGISHEIFLSGLARGRARARHDFGVEIRWIFDIVRSFDDQQYLHALADYTVSLAIESKDEGVVALGLGGAENGYPPEPFAPYFERARMAGLHRVPHAGETSGPASVWGAIKTLGAERIGHGIRSIEDQELLQTLVAERIPLEVCPTSNICLTVYPNLQEHPLPRLLSIGVAVTINSDDPPLFNTTLTDELILLHTAFHLDLPTIEHILLNSVQCSFLPTQQKDEMERSFQEEMQRLKAAFS
jgi:aminodeoxyfutalosine deaminase